MYLGSYLYKFFEFEWIIIIVVFFVLPNSYLL